jgi:hypothetical protein
MARAVMRRGPVRARVDRVDPEVKLMSRGLWRNSEVSSPYTAWAVWIELSACPILLAGVDLLISRSIAVSMRVPAHPT